MATTNLGKVSVTPKGAWNSSNAYEKLDIVTSGGNGYIALKDVPSGTAITNTSYWLKFADKGDKGDTGEINGASASISGGYGSPSVSVTEGGTSTDRSFAFAFSNLKGNGIESIVLQGTSGAEKTYRITFSDGTHFDFVVTDGEVTEESLVETLESYAQIDGYYEDLTSGSTEEVISNVKITDQEPYTFRTSGGNAEIGSREEDTLVGVSVAFNQLMRVHSTSISRTENGVTFTDNRDGTYSVQTDENGATANTWLAPYSIYGTNGHKYYWHSTPVGGSASTYYSYVSGFGGTRPNDYGDGVINTNVNTNGTVYPVMVYVKAGTVITTPIVFRPQLFDLTLAFGSDIADYLYTLEQAQAGEGVALAKKLGLNKYLGYNAGTLYSAQTDAHKMTRFNQLNPNSYIIGSTSHYNLNVGEVLNSDGTTARAEVSGTNPFTINVKAIWAGITFISDELVAGHEYRAKSNMKATTSGNLRSSLYIIDANNTVVQRLDNFVNDGNKTNTFTVNDSGYRLAMYVGANVAQNVTLTDPIVFCRWDNSRDADYEPYVLHSYPIDPVVLRGILKKDADGNIYADGDTYEADGTVTRKYGIVDLGELNWTKYNEGAYYVFYSNVLTLCKANTKLLATSKYVYYGGNNHAGLTDKTFSLFNSTDRQITIRDSAFNDSDATTFKTAMSGVYLIYELAEPTTEQATPFTTPQIVDNWGTEEYPDYAVAQGDREYSVPMGHTTLYPISIRDKVEASADNPSNDGVYILQMSGGKATYIPLIIEDELPTMPTQDGTYTLKTVVSSGTATLSWVAE